MRVHVGLILVFAWCKASEIFLDENADPFAIVKELLAIDRYLIACRPCKYNGLRQTHGHDVFGQKCSWIDTCGTTFQFVLEFASARKSGARAHDSFLVKRIHLGTRQSQSN